MKLATHNSLTYLKPKHWWMRLFKFCYQCQDKDIIRQYNDGVRYFDFRFSFNNDRELEIRHKLVPFKYDIFDFVENLKCFNSKHDVIIRVVLEKNSKETDEIDFLNLCKTLEENYLNITFCCGEDVHSKKVVYKFKAGGGPQVIEQYGSVRGGILGGLWPKRWAKKHNQEIYETYKDTEKYLMIDFYETIKTIH